MTLDAQTQEAVTQAVSLGGISSLGSACWEILTAPNLTWKGFLRGLVLALFVAVLCYEGLKGQHIDDGLKFVITGLLAFCADYILRAIISFAKYATNKPVDLIIRLMRG